MSSLSRSLRWSALAAVVLTAAISCGGAKKGEPGDKGGGAADDLDTQDGAGAAVADAGPIEADAAPPPAPVTFVLKNSGAQELALNMDRGYAGVILAWSGKPPKAKPILMFPTFCTMACDAAEEERCPLCEQPEKVADIRKAQQLEKIAPGASLEVPWDANVFVYQKTKGKRDGRTKKCQCYTTEPVAPETYTVRACGLRLTTETGKSTQLVCAEGSMTLPSEEPVRVELDFVK